MFSDKDARDRLFTTEISLSDSSTVPLDVNKILRCAPFLELMPVSHDLPSDSMETHYYSGMVYLLCFSTHALPRVSTIADATTDTTTGSAAHA